MYKPSACIAACALVCSAAGACAGRNPAERGQLGANGGRSGVAAAVAGAPGEAVAAMGAAARGGANGLISQAGTRSGAPGEGADAGPHCATKTTTAELQPTYLFVAFDVSGSMGKGDKPWHDKTLKWDPVVAATSEFFEDVSSAGFSAALTFFPAAGGDDTRCEAESYYTPDVPLSALPSTRFREAMEQIGKSDWRGGTPTLYALQGVFEQIAQARKTLQARYVVVLVTDGYPQDCDDDSIDSVAQFVSERASDVPTYVIGVTNPPVDDDAPDVTTNLTQIAKAGATERAYLIDTGDPSQTVKAFSATIDLIRRASLSCQVRIPDPPAGETFDKEKVSVSYRKSGSTVSLKYDAACTAEQSWRYDDPKSPREIVLCPKVCGALQSDEQAQLHVAFECEQVIVVPD